LPGLKQLSSPCKQRLQLLRRDWGWGRRHDGAGVGPGKF
jgi:hypothetical protein